ncbi:MAG: hypothetical protein AUK55_05780 [Syntrophobacteraceae bacterium CG2_30_61_12]|nr:MAG: hypothetical protein AUK55_05780 [Syntrophobacteraceae bacterium CG2_30_61_12]
MLRSCAQLINYKELIKALIVRDLKTRYKRSFLGYLWALLDPLLMMGVFILVFGTILQSTVDYYPIFLLSGLVPWSFFSGTIQQSVDSITRNRGLIEKVYCPREVFPLTVVLSNGVNMAFSLVVLFALTSFYRIRFAMLFTLLVVSLAILSRLLGRQRQRWQLPATGAAVVGLCLYQPDFGPLLLLLGFAVFCLSSLALGLALVFACLNVFFADVTYIVQVLLRLGFFLCPIFWALESGRLSDTHLHYYLLANPLAVILQMFRSVALGYPWPGVGYLLLTGTVSIVSAGLGYFIFKRSEDIMVKRI